MILSVQRKQTTYIDTQETPMARGSTQHLSLQPVEKRALRLLAERQARGNISDLAARLIVKAAREEFGSDWVRVVTEASDEVREAIPA
jgi:hypothetical protein